MRRAAFLDRDGVINVDTGYLHRVEEFAFVPGAVDAMRRLAEAGYLLVIVTNQSGIARGLFDEAAYATLTRHMLEELARAGVAIAGVYHCPHLDGCDCRKPAPGMIQRALGEHAIDATASILIGDKGSDIAAGRAAGVGRCFLVGGARDGDADAHHPDLARCADAVLAAEAPAPQLGLSARAR